MQTLGDVEFSDIHSKSQYSREKLERRKWTMESLEGMIGAHRHGSNPRFNHNEPLSETRCYSNPVARYHCSGVISIFSPARQISHDPQS